MRSVPVCVRNPATRFLRELKDRHNVEDAEFLVDGMGYTPGRDSVNCHDTR
jgi:hypothetical protein